MTPNKKQLIQILLIFVWTIVMSVECYATRLQEYNYPSPTEIKEYVNEVAMSYDISPELIIAVIEHESCYNPNVERDGCVGLMQINPKFFKDRMNMMDISDPYDWKSNIRLGTDYIHELAVEYTDPYLCLMIYNQGYTSAISMWEKERISAYAIYIMERAQELEREDIYGY